MASILDLCQEQRVGRYDSLDRTRVGGSLPSLQPAGSGVNCMKASYPGAARPLGHFPELPQRLKAGVEALVARGVPYREAERASDPDVPAWLEPLYAARPRAGTVVAIVRTIEGVSRFSGRPRQHPRAEGDPQTGRRPAQTAELHLTRARHHILVSYVYAAPWGRASTRLSGSLPFGLSRQLNGHAYLERQGHRPRRRIEMADNAVRPVRAWAARPPGPPGARLEPPGGYSGYRQTVKSSHHFVFRSAAAGRPGFEPLRRHTQRRGRPGPIRSRFGLRRGPRRATRRQVTPGPPRGGVKAFYGPHGLKGYDKHGRILRVDLVIHPPTDCLPTQRLSNLPALTRLGQAVGPRLERACLTAVAAPACARAYPALVDPGTAARGRRYAAMRPARPAQPALWGTLASLAHGTAGFSTRALRAKHQEQPGVPLKPSPATYRLRTLRAHGLVEPVGDCRRYQLTAAGRPSVAFPVKVHQHLFAPVVNAARDGLYHFRTAIAPDPIADALHALLVALGIARPHPAPAGTNVNNFSSFHQ